MTTLAVTQNTLRFRVRELTLSVTYVIPQAPRKSGRRCEAALPKSCTDGKDR